MRRYLGFNCQQLGDLAMATCAARCLKRVDPDSHLTFGIAGDFREFAPLLIDHPHVDRVHILHRSRDGFDDEDRRWITEQRFTHVFNPMADHSPAPPWWTVRGQALEAAAMHGLPTEGDDGKVQLTPWFKPVEGLRDHIAFSPWPSFHEGPRNPKAIPPERAQEVVNAILALGYKVLQVGGPDEPALDGATKLQAPYFESVRHVMGCRAMVMGDSGLNWVLSGYDFPVVGLYAERYFGRQWVHNIQPINPNGRYLVGATVSDIPVESITSALAALLA